LIISHKAKNLQISMLPTNCAKPGVIINNNMGSYFNYYESSKLFQGSLMQVMGTRLDAVLLGQSKEHSEEVWLRMISEVDRLQKMLNKFDSESELACLNRLAAEAPTSVSEELWNILLACRNYHRLTFGYFDISLKDFTKVNLDLKNRTVRFLQEGLQLDLSGYAKGYALESFRKILLAAGFTQSFISFGSSSVLALGTHPHGENWVVGINDPYFPESILGTMELKDSAMSTSGNSPQHSNHIIDPHTGINSDKRIVVSVSMKSAVEAEALSTALLVANEKISKQIISNFNLDKMLVFHL
jgi:thiamine biosynthesis lipoprotein